MCTFRSLYREKVFPHVGKVVECVLEQPRVDERRERAGGDARLDPHPDAGRVDVAGIPTRRRAGDGSARFAHRGGAVWATRERCGCGAVSSSLWEIREVMKTIFLHFAVDFVQS
jgi:hypothetical protein